MKRLIYTLATLALLLNMTLAQTTRKARTKPQDKSSSGIIEPAATGNPVTGSGTVGRLSKWTGVDGSNSFSLGNSIIFEDKFGKVGIGTITPTSVLTVQGMIQTTLGGYKFPDGTVQTTSAANALLTVSRDTTLTGNGTTASPLGVAVPLTLQGSQTGVSFPILQVTNTGNNGSAINGFAGNGMNGTAGGNGVTGLAGNSDSGEGGAGIVGAGGNTDSGPGGPGIGVFGGSSNSGFGGAGVFALGGRSAGTGNQARGGDGMVATGGNVGTNGKAGDGVVATGGDYPEGGTPGHGVVATGGHHRGSGVVAKGADELGGTFDGGEGVSALGGASSGAGRSSGHGITAIAGNNLNGADKGLAGFFIGSVRILGDLNVNGTKNFRIDHPLDPENKYLVHAAIESSEVLNVYSGNIRTDGNGDAVVILPEWFEALNKDLRYQLTVIGTFAQAIIAEKVKQNRFVIKTNGPNVEVSWQVTGVRSDAVMQKHPFKAEEAKTESERGTYLSPEAHGQPEEKGAEWVRHPDLMQRLKQQRLEAEQVQKPRKPNNR
jgi:hypothetical protein